MVGKLNSQLKSRSLLRLENVGLRRSNWGKREAPTKICVEQQPCRTVNPRKHPESLNSFSYIMLYLINSEVPWWVSQKHTSFRAESQAPATSNTCSPRESITCIHMPTTATSLSESWVQTRPKNVGVQTTQGWSFKAITGEVPQQASLLVSMALSEPFQDSSLFMIPIWHMALFQNEWPQVPLVYHLIYLIYRIASIVGFDVMHIHT